jgi:hypothetical protein
MRLTKSVCEEIINNSLIQSGIIKREKILSGVIAKLAEDCRIHAFGGVNILNNMLDTVEMIKGLIKDLPKEADFNNFQLNKAHYISVSFGGMSVYLHYKGSFSDTRYTTIKNNEPSYTSGFAKKYLSKISPNEKLLLSASNKFSKRFETIHQKIENLKTERNLLISKLNGALSTYTTTNALLKDWPDMKPLIPLPPEKSVKHLPMVKISELNKIIGLPVK